MGHPKQSLWTAISRKEKYGCFALIRQVIPKVSSYSSPVRVILSRLLAVFQAPIPSLCSVNQDAPRDRCRGRERIRVMQSKAPATCPLQAVTRASAEMPIRSSSSLWNFTGSINCLRWADQRDPVSLQGGWHHELKGNHDNILLLISSTARSHLKQPKI